MINLNMFILCNMISLNFGYYYYFMMLINYFWWICKTFGFHCNTFQFTFSNMQHRKWLPHASKYNGFKVVGKKQILGIKLIYFQLSITWEKNIRKHYFTVYRFFGQTICLLIYCKTGKYLIIPWPWNFFQVKIVI